MAEEQRNWFVLNEKDKKSYGPFTLEELKSHIKAGRVHGLDKVARKGEPYRSAYSVPELSGLFVKKQPSPSPPAEDKKEAIPKKTQIPKSPAATIDKRRKPLIAGGIIALFLILVVVGLLLKKTGVFREIQKFFSRSGENKEVPREVSITGTPEDVISRAREIIKKGTPEEFPQAEKELNVLLMETPGYEPALYALQELYFEWGRKSGVREKIEKSIQVGENLVSLNSHNADAFTLLAFAYNELGMLNETIKSAEAAFRLRQDDWRITYLLGELYLMDNATRGKAIEFFEKTVQINPEQYDSHKRLARLYEEEGRYNDAVRHLEKLVTIAPKEEELFFSLGLNYYRINKFKECVRAYKSCIDLKPDHINARINLSKVLFEKLEDLDEAMINIEQLLTNYADRLSDFDWKYFSVALGRIYLNKERFEDGKRIFEAVLERDPDYIDAHFYLGDALFATGRFHEAEKEYREVLRRNPESAAAHLSLARVMEKIQRRDLAIDELKEVLRIDPTFSEANYILGKYNDIDGYYYEAMEYYRNAIKHAPKYLEAHYALAQDAFKLGDNKLAIEEFKIVKSLDPMFGEVCYFLGEAYFADGNIKSAVKEYKEYLKIDTKGKHRQEAEARLRYYK